MFSIMIEVVGTKAKIYKVNIGEGVLIALAVTDQDVLQLEIIVDLANAVDFFKDLQKLAADLTYCLKAESFVTHQEVMMQRLAQLLHDNEGVTLGDFLEAVFGPTLLSAQLHDGVVVNVLINNEFAAIIYFREQFALWFGEFVELV